MSSQWTWLWIACGGFLGAVARYHFTHFVSRKWKVIFPIGTLIVNLTGCLAIGWCMAHPWEPVWRWISVVGFLGAFTTFSTINIDLMQMMLHKMYKHMILYVITTYVLGIIFVGIGYYL